jgi:hypothetical protein
LTAIAQNTFQNCSVLQSVSFGSALESIGNYAFSGCSAITSVSLPASLKTVGTYAFQNSTLAWVKWPAAPSGATLGANAFNGCRNLTRVELPDNMATVTTNNSAGINAAAFKGTALRVLILRADAVGLATNASTAGTNYGFPDTAFSIYVPDAKVGDYQAADGWKKDGIREKIVSINSLPALDEPSNWN